jgi:protein gp37
MVLNKQKGNMYGFVTHTWNPIKGKCSHDCSYCYMKVFPQKPLRLVEKELQDDLGSGNFIFVGSSTDMFAKDVPKEWILKVLKHMSDFSNNTYLLQSKNPSRYNQLIDYIPTNTILGTTIETNSRGLSLRYSNAPYPLARVQSMSIIKDFKKMVTIEPIIEFDLTELLSMIIKINPKWVNIGADSKGHKLQEPSPEKIIDLIYELRKFTEVKLKSNLNRIIGGVIQ